MKSTELQIKLGSYLQKIRQANNLSQEDVSEKTGLHRTYIGSIERGERNITIKNLVIICKALDIKVSDLFREINL